MPFLRHCFRLYVSSVLSIARLHLAKQRRRDAYECSMPQSSSNHRPPHSALSGLWSLLFSSPFPSRVSSISSALPPLLYAHALSSVDSLCLLGNMLREHLLAILCLVLPNEPRVPQLARNAQVLAASHESIRFACLRSGGYARGVKVLLLASGDRY